MEKRCFKCDAVKPLDAFYTHPMMADGHLNKCKECNKRDVRDNYAKRRPYYHAYERDRNQMLFRRAQRPERQRRRRKMQPQKYYANGAVCNAVRDGRLIRQPCEVCGAIKSQAHHDDYSKPLDVRWLCFKHHREIGHGQVVSAA